MRYVNSAEFGDFSPDKIRDYANALAQERGTTSAESISKLESLVQEIHDVANIIHLDYDFLYVLSTILITSTVQAHKDSVPGPEPSIDDTISANGVVADPDMSYAALFIKVSFPSGISHYVPITYEALQSLRNTVEHDYKSGYEGHYLPTQEAKETFIVNAHLRFYRLPLLQYLAYLGLRPLSEEESTVIPPNSPTLLMDSTTARFSSAVWFQRIQEKVITLAGCGGIGSWVALLLSRLKPRSIFLYDDDRVESVNMAGQFFSRNDMDVLKVNAVASACDLYSSYNSVFAIPERFTLTSEASDIMICGFDNMKARSDYFNAWLQHVKDSPVDQRAHCLFLDGRLAAEICQIFCIRGDDDYNINLYQQKYLFSDAEADPTICSYKQTSYMATFIASVMVNLFINFVANEITDGIRELPFYTSYEGDSLFFQTVL